MAGIKKKRKTTRRKVKSSNTKPKIDSLQELNGFEVGQKVWYTTLGNDTGYGSIIKFYPNEPAGPVVEIYDEINYGFRCNLLETASTKPPLGGMRKLTNARLRRTIDPKKKK